MRLGIACAVVILLSACGHAKDESTAYNLLDHQQVSGNYPVGPDPVMTPGALCSNPDSYRYPEHIPYCERNVGSGEKKAIITKYDVELGFNIRTMARTDFKIDHYIPLCMGGANTTANLWPQHKSVYAKTDQIEMYSCQLMAQGKLKQKDAVKMIKDVKNNLSTADHVLQNLKDQL